MAGAQIRATRRRLQIMGMGEPQIEGVLKTGRADPSVSVVSPAAGTLLQVEAQAGQYVRAGASLFTLGGGDRIWVETWMLPEEALAYPEGSEAWVELEGASNAPIRGRLEHKQQETAVSGSLAIAHIGIPNPGGRIPAGRQAWVTLSREGRMALNVPASALLESGSETMIWLRTGPHEFAPRMVKTGLRTPAAVEILEGIEAGSEVVTSGAYLLNSEWVLRQGAGMRHAGH
jgi:Cu(I)/Ag(I) efflux system membrane fusion protein